MDARDATFAGLVDQQANGWVITYILHNPNIRMGKPWTWSAGPYVTEKEARRAATRARREEKTRRLNDMVADRYPDTQVLSVNCRPLWNTDAMDKAED